MKEALRTYMLTKTIITDIVSSDIYSFPAPQGQALPFIMLTRVSEEAGRNLIAPDERYREVWQIDCYHSSDQSAETLKNAVRVSLDICSPFTMGDYTIYNMFMDYSNDLSELEQKGGQEGVYRKQMDFIVIRKKTKNP